MYRHKAQNPRACHNYIPFCVSPGDNHFIIKALLARLLRIDIIDISTDNRFLLFPTNRLSILT